MTTTTDDAVFYAVQAGGLCAALDFLIECPQSPLAKFMARERLKEYRDAVDKRTADVKEVVE
jgi:hypothetical protein